MRKPQRVALVGAGKLSDSPVVRLRNLADHLGPVKAPSLRVASRIANTLRAGRPVPGFQDFEHATLVLIGVPDHQLPALIDEMKGALDWTHKIVVLCSYGAGCEALCPLEEAGACTGSVATIPGFDARWFLIEGDKKVERFVKPLIGHRGVRITTIERLKKIKYLQALQSAGPLLIPSIREASEALRQAGIAPLEIEAMLEKQVWRSIRSYFRSGKAGG